MNQLSEKVVDDFTVEEAIVKERQESVKTEQYLTFYLVDEEYGIEITSVQGIQGWTSVTSIPNTPNYILGVINLRGQIVPIMDLRLRFSLEQAQLEANTVVIVVKLIKENKEKFLGIVVDGVSETYRFDCNKIQPPLDLGVTNKSNFLKGLASVDERVVILLDIDQLINFDEIDKITEKS